MIAAVSDGHSRDDELYSEPQVRFVAEVLEDIHRGELLIPRFQRPFVWSADMRMSLFDSVLQRIPIGAIMVWQSRTKKVALRKRLGPFRLPEPAEGPLRRYLLDGEQRLATLYFALYEAKAAEASGEDSPDDFRIFYDLIKEGFVARSELGASVPNHMLSLADLLEGRRLTRFQRELAKGREDGGEALIERADAVANAFRQYKLPVVTLRSESVELVTRTFQRVNTQQATMDEVHMVNALSWDDGFDLLARFDAIREGELSDVGWADLEDLTILRVCKAAIGIDVYVQEPERLGAALRGRPEVLAGVERALLDTAAFFRDELGMGHLELIPYTPQVIVIASVLYETKELTEGARRRLWAWVWLTTSAEVFQRQLSDSSFRKQIEAVRAIVEDAPESFPEAKLREQVAPFPRRFDPRSARSRALTVLMWEQRRSHLAPNAEGPSPPLRQPVKDRVAHLITSQMGGADLAVRVGARIVADAAEAARVREACDREARNSAQVSKESWKYLESYVIPTYALENWEQGQLESFIGGREEYLEELEWGRFQEALEVLRGWFGPSES